LNHLEIKDLNLVDYIDAWDLMKSNVSLRSATDQDEVWLAEHNPVYTLGHAANEEFIFDDNDIPVVRTDRGGQITYHGPGQLMIYFLINLKRLGWGPKRLICELEGIVIELLERYEIHAQRREGAPGIYVDEKKIASIGLKIKRGFCYHGISLNVDMDLKPFGGIVTCGIPSLEVVQVSDFIEISMTQIKADLIELIKDHNTEAA
tara:strand:- start:833 stop:1447 length:615 start_codon:yes stop_codon:yes gene_type:complete